VPRSFTLRGYRTDFSHRRKDCRKARTEASEIKSVTPASNSGKMHREEVARTGIQTDGCRKCCKLRRWRLWDSARSGAGNRNLAAQFHISAERREPLRRLVARCGKGDPRGSLIRDSSGNLHGTTAAGGAANVGVVYELDTACRLTVRYSFTGGADGAYPFASQFATLPATSMGPPSRAARRVLVWCTSWTWPITKRCYTAHRRRRWAPPLRRRDGRCGGTDGRYPNAGVVLDSASNLYGTTHFGGTAGLGVVYELDTANQPTVLYSFTGTPDGANPDADVVFDSNGN